jgi:hypothetical protein
MILNRTPTSWRSRGSVPIRQNYLTVLDKSESCNFTVGRCALALLLTKQKLAALTKQNPAAELVFMDLLLH